MLATLTGLGDHSLLSILPAAESTPALAACCACCLSAGIGAEYVLPVMLHAWLQCLHLGQPQLLQQTELLSASFYWLLAELLWML